MTRQEFYKQFLEEHLPELTLFDGINPSDIETFRAKLPFVYVKGGRGYKVSFHNTADVCFRLSGKTVEESFVELDRKVSEFNTTLNNFLTGRPDDDGIINRLSELINLIYEECNASEPLLLHLQTQIDNTNDRITALAARVGQNETNIAGNTTVNNTQNTKIRALEDKDKTLETNINKNKSDITQVNSKVTALETRFNAVDFNSFVNLSGNQVITGAKTFANQAYFQGSLHARNIEFDQMPASAGHGGYIDFHYNRSGDDFTSRIIEGARGVLTYGASAQRMSQFFGVEDVMINRHMHIQDNHSGEYNQGQYQNYIHFTNGLLIQWGGGSSNSYSGTMVYFPKPFYSANSYSLACGRNDSGWISSAGYSYGMRWAPSSASGFRLYSDSSQNSGHRVFISWIAIGRSA